MIIIYADLVELGLRTLSEEKSQEGVVLVPSFYRDKVRLELDKRGTHEGIYS